MARGSIPNDGLIIDLDDPPQKTEQAKIYIDLDQYSDSEEAQEAKVEREQDYRIVKTISNDGHCSFDQFLVDFWKETSTQDIIRPIPPMLGDGQPVDLKTLFLLVIGKGGYDAVTKNYLWDFVAEKFGIAVNIGSSAKLIYWKYLSTLEIWLIKVSDARVLGYNLIGDDGVKFGSQLMELQAEIKRILLDYITPNTTGGKSKVQDGLDMAGNLYNTDGTIKMLAMKLMNALDVGSSSNTNEENNVRMARLSNEDGLKEGDNDDNDVMILDPSSVNKENFGRKRKRKSMQELLCWLTNIAKNPSDPRVCSILDRSKWSPQTNEEVQRQIMLFRGAVLTKRKAAPNHQHENVEGLKMHPSMYDDNANRPKRMCILKEGMKCSACDRTLPIPNEKYVPLIPLELLESDLEPEPEQPDSSKSPRAFEPDSNMNARNPHTKDGAKKTPLLAKCATKHIPIGPNYQASVPKWTGETFESEPKWLGTQIWPLKSANRRLAIEERDVIGKGRDEFCNCPAPGSVECVKVHIAEKRAKLELELDEAFYQWNFNKLGEEISHYWTYSEEKKFMDVMKANVSSPKKCLWDHINRSLPHKSRQDLVNYYFNVFVLRRRRFQNQHPANDIDSDDDELESEPLKKKSTSPRGRSRK